MKADSIFNDYIPTRINRKYDKKINNVIEINKKIDANNNINFIDAIKTYAYNDNEEPIILNNWHIEHSLLISNLKISETLTSGCCQNFKTLSHILLHIYLIVEKQFNSLWVYSQERVLNNMVNLQFKPMVRYWLANSDRENNSRNSAKNNRIYQYRKANGIFSYASTSTKSNNSNTAAGNAMVSFSADIAFYEERSQWTAGSDAPVSRRLDASRIPSKPIRQLGTPGRDGTGITEAAKGCDYHFEPHCICDGCDREIRLTPKGTLLKQTVREKPSGQLIKSFLGANGKPNEWFYHDANKKIKTAYFGCPHCDREISKYKRLHHSYFRCIKTNRKLIDFLDYINSENYDLNDRVSVFIYLSPLLKDTEYNLASEIISEGIKTTDAEDWCQQQLGLASQVEVTKITDEMILDAIRTPVPDFNYPSWVLD